MHVFIAKNVKVRKYKEQGETLFEIRLFKEKYLAVNIEEYRIYCLSKKGVTEETPFPKLQHILVFKVLGKMFTATDINTFSSFSVKCKPETIDELRAEYPSMQEPSYFSKKHWSNVIMDGAISDKLLYEWLDISYNLVVEKLTKKMKDKLENE